MALIRYSIVCLVLLTSCTSQSPITEIGDTCAVLFDQASQQYSDQQFEAHAKTVGRTLSFISRLPLSVLDGCEGQFHETLRHSDVRAHLSIAKISK